MIPDKEVEIAVARVEYWRDELDKSACSVRMQARESSVADFESALARFTRDHQNFMAALTTLDNLAKKEVEKRAIEGSQEQDGGAK